MQSESPRYVCRNTRGFTIIELVTVIAIVAIMLRLAVPSFQEFIVNYRSSVQTNSLLADLAVARSEAVKFARVTQVQAAPGGWTDGWIVGTDLNVNGMLDPEEIVKRQGPAEDGFTLEGGTTAGVPAAAIGFGVTGQLVLPAGALNVEFSICRPDNNAAKSGAVVVARSGRAASQKAVLNASFNC